MSETGDQSPKVPFGPWKTFKTFIESDLKAKSVPQQIDGSLFRGKSGTDGRQLRAALKFFSLVEGPNNRTTDRLRAVVDSYGTDSWTQTVHDLLEAYQPIVHGVDIEKGSPGELEEAFRQSGLNGSTLRKAIRLYLAMATEAGVKLSAHFPSIRGLGSAEGSEPSNGNGSPVAPKSKRKRPSRTGGQAASQDDGIRRPPEGVLEIKPLPNCDFRVWLPEKITQKELEFAMKYLRDYIKLRES